MDFAVIVPAVTLRTEAGDLDLPAIRQYASRAAHTWVDRFLLNGSTTRGFEYSAADRLAVLEAWLETVNPVRLLACCWTPEDVRDAVNRHVTPMAVMSGLPNMASALQFLAELPEAAAIYSHPTMFDGLPFTPDLAAAASVAECLPIGGKLAKVDLSVISEIRNLAPDFQTWDGSSRQVRKSLEAGAVGIVATPLAGLIAGDLPPKDIDVLQGVLDRRQSELDLLSSRNDRHRALNAETRSLIRAAR
ncbi:hypothetical protein ACW9HH_36455 [Nocardia gipuzkoensis]